MLWRALKKARLIFPTPDSTKHEDDVNWDGCDYSKCGRTDRGVSAFGQVVGIRVRSNRPPRQEQDSTTSDENIAGVSNEDGITESLHGSDGEGITHPAFQSVDDEIPYAQVLNRLLPPDIRVLAWCPSPPKNFNARFACRERRYKYFFTQPAFAPSVGERGFHNSSPNLDRRNRREGWLDIAAMREAAKKFEGVHDFRNFCKLDASKQIENFERRMFYADIEELDPRKGPVGYVGLRGFREHEDQTERQMLNGHASSTVDTPKIYTFTLHGSAFLWHQVRHMVAILFLVGQGLESPDIVDKLLNTRENPLKPQYDMADDAPLVLWDCIFPEEGNANREDALSWMYLGDYTGQEKGVLKALVGSGSGKYGTGGIVEEMWKVWRQRKIDEVLAGTLLDVLVDQGELPKDEDAQLASRRQGSQKVFAGDNGTRPVGTYKPVMQRPRMESVEVLNARYAKHKIAMRPISVEKTVSSRQTD